MSCNICPACGETGRSGFPQDGANVEDEHIGNDTHRLRIQQDSGSKLGVMIIPIPTVPSFGASRQFHKLVALEWSNYRDQLNHPERRPKQLLTFMLLHQPGPQPANFFGHDMFTTRCLRCDTQR